jgi:DNA-binding transcriptional ArsR family regulator
MVAAPPDRLDRVFAALADPTRRTILARLADGDATVNQLVALFDHSQPTISKHLKVLERAGLVTSVLGREPRPARRLRARAATEGEAS